MCRSGSALSPRGFSSGCGKTRTVHLLESKPSVPTAPTAAAAAAAASRRIDVLSQNLFRGNIEPCKYFSSSLSSELAQILLFFCCSFDFGEGPKDSTNQTAKKEVEDFCIDIGLLLFPYY